VIGFLVALESFVDPTDGMPVEAGRTYVSPRSDVYRMFPHRFKRVIRWTADSPEAIDRIGGMTEFGRVETRQRVSAVARSAGLRPAWQLQREPWRLT